MTWMKRAAILMFLAVVVLLVPYKAIAQGTFYVEEPKDGRIYVFYFVDSYTMWKNGGEMGKSITRIGYGPNSETVVFDSNEAINIYNYKHNLPMETFAAPAAGPAVQEKLPYKFSGYMFGDYFYNSRRDDNIAALSNVASQPGAQDFNGFIFRRIYFTFDDQISPVFTTRFRLEADSTALSSNGKISVFVKDAYLKWTFTEGQDLTFGIQPTPAYDISEAAWAYRSLEKTIMDLRGIVPSRDIAASVRGRLTSSGKFNYWFMFGNGSGNNPETDKFKRVYGLLHFKPNAKFQATFYLDYRALPDIPSPINPTVTVGNSSKTIAWFVNYGSAGKYGLGYEGFTTKQDNAFFVPPARLDAKNTIGHSFWAWYNMNDRFGVVGRYDLFDPNNDSSGDKRDLFIISGVIKPHKNVFIMPNLYWEGYDDIAGKSVKSSVTPRITFYYVFL